MATNKGPSKIAFLPELQGSEAMTALLDRVRGLAAKHEGPGSDSNDQCPCCANNELIHGQPLLVSNRCGALHARSVGEKHAIR